MASCKYCGRPAGFFRSEHEECAAAHGARLEQARRDSAERLQKAQDDLLALLDKGVLPQWPGAVPPVNLIGGESVAWVFSNVEFLRDKTKRSYAGVYGGPSVHLFRGVSVRVGGFKGAPITSVDRVSMGGGSLILTTQRIYFYGESTSLRVPYKKIASFLPFSNGVGIIKDSTSALPQIFVTGNDFAFEMLTRIAHLSANPAQSVSATHEESPYAVTSEINDPEFTDSIYQNAIDIVVKTQRASISGLQRHLRISFPMASKLMELLEADGIVSQPQHDGNREVLRAS